jgi:hypothetical protein
MGCALFFYPSPASAYKFNRIISTPRPLIDSLGCIFVVLAGQPRNDAYAATAHGAFVTITKAGTDARFPADMCRHRRGLFAAISVGLSYGKGQRLPGWLDNKQYSGLADGLLDNKHIKRLAGFADGSSLHSSARLPCSPIP